MRKLQRLFPALVTLATVVACEAKSGTFAFTPLLSSEKLDAGSACADGGVRVASGLDVNHNGKLDPEEANSAVTFCNDKAHGRLVRTTAEPAGSHCASGGQKVDIGLDDGAGGGVAGDGELQDGEVDSTTYMCNGSDGATGKDGKDGKDGAVSLVSLLSEPAGPHCAHGGTKIASGLDDGGQTDTAHDGVLGPSEMTAFSYVCNPASVYATLVQVTPAPACASGGYVIRAGRDDGRGGAVANDGVLGDSEIESTATVCNGAKGDQGATGDHGFSSLVRVSDAGAACAAGGKKIETGLDDGAPSGIAGNGVLEDGEVDAVSYVCNGVAGAAGAAGANGFSSLVVVKDAGAACAAGGRRIESGRDDGAPSGIANDGILQAGEVEQSSLVCNGANGTNGTNGFSSLVAVTDAGASCPNGGKKITSGLDDGLPSGTANDGILQPGEVDSTSTVCNGTNGANGTNGFASLVAVSDAGASCATGGKKVETGLDDGLPAGTARDGILQPGEVETVSYVCNGANGSNGTNGFNTLVAISNAPGAQCPTGGKQIDTGVDDGLPSGTARDGILQAGEVEKTSYVCNGTNGTNGSNGTNGTNGFSTLVRVSDGAAGCATGGKKIESGLDDGLPSGTARDGVLQAGEVESTSYVCNGAAGANGGGGGLNVYDANNVALGALVYTSSYGVTVRTAQGYFVDYSWSGRFFESQIYYSTASCNPSGATRWLNAGGATTELLTTKWVYWEGSGGGFLVPQDNGAANNDSLSAAVSFSASSLWNYGSCQSGGNNSGWPLTPVTRATAGIPASIAAPLKIQ